MMKGMEDWTDAKLDAFCERINQALYTTDPMHTCCVENDCKDEYYAIAESVVNYMLKGESQRQALTHALEDSFGDLVTAEKVDVVLNTLAEKHQPN
ncbi:hypothetical protein [Pseudidiomarina sp.]|uniref:hypothetical protein n=1 Tax=Pseudidiomarina sp. TaxID=2081707 RepID=UPI003A9844F3